MHCPRGSGPAKTSSGAERRFFQKTIPGSGPLRRRACRFFTPRHHFPAEGPAPANPEPGEACPPEQGFEFAAAEGPRHREPGVVPVEVRGAQQRGQRPDGVVGHRVPVQVVDDQPEAGLSAQGREQPDQLFVGEVVAKQRHRHHVEGGFGKFRRKHVELPVADFREVGSPLAGVIEHEGVGVDARQRGGNASFPQKPRHQPEHVAPAAAEVGEGRGSRFEV